MLKYQDGWFGHHPLFCYYVFNWIMREQVLNTTHFLCSQSDENGLFLNKLSDFINGNGDGQLLNKIIWHAWNFKNTRPYWRQKRNKLIIYTENIKSRFLFFTLSTADLHWHDLHSYMPLFNKYEAANEAQCYQIAF